MILNERQYAISQRKLRDAEDNIKHLRAGEGDVAADDRRVAMASLEAFAQQLRGELAEYAALRSGATPAAPVAGLEALPLALIRARIAKRLTQAQLADRLGMKEQQIQRYEVTRYAAASLARLQEVARALEVTIDRQERVDQPETAHRSVWRKPLVLMMLDSLERRWHRPAQGALEMQKLLLNCDAHLRENFGFHAFEFEPYRLGPYDPFLEDDIEFLAVKDLIAKRVDLVSVAEDQVLVAELRTVPLAPTERAHEWLKTFEDDDRVAAPAFKNQVRRIVDAIVADYGALRVSDLMARTYAEHAEMTTRSEIREEMTRRAEERGW